MNSGWCQFALLSASIFLCVGAGIELIGKLETKHNVHPVHRPAPVHRQPSPAQQSRPAQQSHPIHRPAPVHRQPAPVHKPASRGRVTRKPVVHNLHHRTSRHPAKRRPANNRRPSRGRQARRRPNQRSRRNLRGRRNQRGRGKSRPRREGQRCVDNIKCKEWSRKGFCKSNGFDLYTKASLCPNECGYCNNKPPRNSTTDGKREAPYGVWQESMNEKLDPCDDFYKFTCSRFEATHPIKDQTKMESHAAFNTPQERVQKCIMDTIFIPKPSQSSAVQKLRDYQKKFMNIGELDQIRTTEIVKEIKNFGGCPMIPETGWDASKFNVVDMITKMTDVTGDLYLFDLSLKKSINTSQLVLAIAPGRILVSRPQNHIDQNGDVTPDKKQYLKDFISDLFGLLAADTGSAQTYAKISQEAEKVVEMDGKLLKAALMGGFLNRDRPNFDTEEAIQLNNLKSIIPIVNGKDYLVNNPQIPSEIKSYLDNNPTVYLQSQAVLEAFDKIYKSAEKEVLANYLCTHFLVSESVYLDQRFIDAAIRFAKRLSGEYAPVPREVEAIEIMQPLFPLVFDHLFVTHCSTPRTRQQVKTMVDDIQASLRGVLNEQTWMDEETKKYAIYKLAKTKKVVGATDIAYNIAQLDERYKDLQFTSSDSVRQMNKKLTVYGAHQILKMLLTPEKYTQIEYERATTVNAFNMPNENAINILAAILNAPVFNDTMPAAVNYGGIGVVIGHEFLHSFDTMGVDFDAYGNKKSWWKPETYSKFKSRAQCLIDQYSEQVVTQVNKKVNGTNTITENISDNGGLKAAFRAYKLHLKGKTERHVPGYPKYTNEQAFFISYGSIWCNTASNFALENLYLKDEHSPGKFRVNVVLQNSPDFARAFKCKRGSKMNPAKKCALW